MKWNHNVLTEQSTEGSILFHALSRHGQALIRPPGPHVRLAECTEGLLYVPSLVPLQAPAAPM